MAQKESELGITVKKSENMSEWYTQVIQKAELADYTKVSGCIVFRPRAYAIWEKIQAYFDKKIKALGVQNAYFPVLIPESLLTKEARHFEGFTPEVAWVTEAGSSKLAERLAVRPTSETIMYDSYKNWIHSYRDLPLKINQWNNVVRWEFKHPMPFMRTREFLWQEGHTAFATKEEAEEEVLQILDLYAEVYEKLLAIPVLKGKKSEKEKFAGAVYTTSVEGWLPTGKIAQGATSHLLGQNFAKAFDISFVDESEKKQYVWQNSWGLSTRSIGIMIMVHGDDKGLVVPPNVAQNKVVIVPIIFKKDKENVANKAKELAAQLKKYNPILDDREGYTPGFKFNEWEMKGIPIRLELGPKDIEKKQVVLVRRDTGKKAFVLMKEVEATINQTLEEMQEDMLAKAQKVLKESIVEVEDWKEFMDAIKQKMLVYAQWCGLPECEEWIREKTAGAKSINIPFKHRAVKGKCIYCDQEAKVMAYFAKTY
ncbi:MAG: proline--tRNA ligase [Candidatus Woesearchaeota archaeon]